MVELLIELFLNIFVRFAGYYTARILLPIITFGYLYVEVDDIDENDPKFSEKRLVSPEQGAFLGWLFWLVVIIFITTI